MASANTGGFRLVRCPKCLNILPEPANVSVYQCGGCNTTLRAKVRPGSAQNVATKQVQQDSADYSAVTPVNNGASTKQVRQDSGSYSVVTSVGNGVSPQSKELDSIGAALDDTCTPDAPCTETEHESNGFGSNEDGDVMPAEKNVLEVENNECNEDGSSDGRDTDGELEELAALIHGTHIGSDNEENITVERSVESPEACTVGEEDEEECSLKASQPLSDGRGSPVNLPESEQSGACKTEAAANTRSKLVRVQSRSFDLREGARVSVDSLDFHSSRTSFQSKSFRASEPLESKIMKTVDELKGDLSEIFSKPSSDCKPRAHPPRPLKQDGYRPHVAITSSQPLTAYHPATKHSGIASRLSRSGQVAPHGHGLPLPRYRRHSAYSYGNSGQMEMRPCPRQCYHHSCGPPCCSSWKQETTPQKPQVKKMKRRPPPKNLCRPVLRGAPFVLCSNCLRLVQLPTGFAIPSRGTRRLQCGSCSKVLSYSYRDPSRKKLQSPFGGDESSIDDYGNQQADDEYNADAHQADPYSYSEEYGISAGASYSTEDGQPLHVSRNSSFNTIDERSAKESKLHRLMGYSSASELMRRSPDLYESFSRRAPNARTYDMKGKGVCMTRDDSSAEHIAVKSKAKERSVGLTFQGMFKKRIH
ncbi:protein ENHANCED DISEASE RESISTANCE 4-like [Lolium rigidum]|uniref:protein ENHANCED DISEASE RESISTANCE 4-like n=1 Tax=Lolium rigidum TaxID=89674 RepID=UPI001F5CAB14|nr:protein ENHANCED DISEASE RESISTANCE 4-like [Lolium rigidum]XP_047053666.1 protein ENHANCED DISEASE RESISTANCE 4-like [Lolium rigidum]